MPKYFYDHVHLTSLEPLKTCEFYEKNFGAKRIAVRTMPDGRTSVELNLNGSSILVMYPKVKPKSTKASTDDVAYGLEHFGIRTDNIEAAVAQLKANGVKFRDEIWAPRPGIRIAYFWAPENVLIELLEKEP